MQQIIQARDMSTKSRDKQNHKSRNQQSLVSGPLFQLFDVNE